ncbi:hypothetical protein NC651_024738 [Populus alba x Populus x berolinensis]|nr:hypothetical protein NC651_024738 [Populus alba x Populus x berolinensis]
MFRKETEFLSKVMHRNLTVLRGYYTGAPDMRLLVYDYMPNGNLASPSKKHPTIGSNKNASVFLVLDAKN